MAVKQVNGVNIDVPPHWFVSQNPHGQKCDVCGKPATDALHQGTAPPPDSGQSYFRITDMSERFRESSAGRVLSSQEILLWQANFQLAIAQQLSILSQHLGFIREAIEKEQRKGKL